MTDEKSTNKEHCHDHEHGSEECVKRHGTKPEHCGHAHDHHSNGHHGRHHTHNHHGNGCHHNGHERSHENRRALGKTGFVNHTTHEEASVVSATGTIALGHDEARRRMSSAMKELSVWVDDNDGIIGHIKCSLRLQTVVMMSVTLDQLDENESDVHEIEMSLASIVFGIAPDKLAEKVYELLEGIVI